MRCLATIVLLAIAAPSAAIAHHGAEFAALEGFDIGHPGEGYLLGGFDWENYDGFDELSSELSFFVSPLPRLGMGADVRFAEGPDGDWVYSSVTPRVTFQLSDPHTESRFKFGVSVGYQIAEDLRPKRTVTTVEETVRYEDVVVKQQRAVTPVVEGGGGSEGPVCNPLFDLDCPVTKAPNKRVPKHGGVADGHSVTSSSTTQTVTKNEKRKVVTREETTTTVTDAGHAGIHNHDANMWVGRFTAETWIGQTQVVANLIATLPEGDHAYWGYGIGARRQLTEKVGAGVEFVGDFLSDGEHEAIGSLLYDVLPDTTLRISGGVGLTDESPDFTVRAGVLWRF